MRKLATCAAALLAASMTIPAMAAEVELPISTTGETLTIFVPANGDYAYEENLQTLEMEEATGIHLEFITAAASDNIQEKLSTIFASGDLPDIICTGVGAANRYDKATEQSLGEQGLILDLSEYIDTISVGYKQIFDEVDNFREYCTTPDGAIYSLPNLDGSMHVQYNMKCWVNTTWLDNLGLEVPTTTEEFYNMLVAFKEQDANGNGDANDEIPLSTVTSGAGTQIDGFLMAPFQLTPETNKLYLEDGKVVFSPTTDGYKEGLKWLNKLYAEGLLYQESFTWDKNTQVNLNEAGDEPVIGCFLAQRPGYAADLSTEPYSKKWEQYQPIGALEGPDGTAVSAWAPYTGFQTGMVFISSSCENPELAFRFLDYLATQTYRSALGEEGVDYEMLPEDTDLVGLDGNAAKYRSLNSGRTNHTWGQLACLVRTTEFTLGQAYNPDPYAEGVKPLEGRQILLYKGSKLLEEDRQPLESVMPDLYMSSENSSTVSLIKTTLMDTQKDYMVRFITGAIDIDENWDAYLTALENTGLSQYLQLLQDAYDVSAFAK